MIDILPNIIFSILLITSVGFFIYNIKKLIRVIKLGKPINRSDNPKKRLYNMIRIALGQSKMVTKPISGFLHVIVYIGFIIINIELLEILIDGVTGSHRFFSKYFNPSFYNFLIASFCSSSYTKGTNSFLTSFVSYSYPIKASKASTFNS